LSENKVNVFCLLVWTYEIIWGCSHFWQNPWN